MLHVVQILEATTGGTRRHLRDLALGLDREAFRLDVVVSLRRDPRFAADLDLFHRHGIGVHVVPMRRRLAPVADLVAFVRLVRLLRRLRPDVVHTHASKAGMLGRAAARMAGVRRTVHTPHGFAFQVTGAPVRQALYRELERLAVRWTDCLVAVSARERELALEIGFRDEQVMAIANGIDVMANIEHRTSNAELQREETSSPDAAGPLAFDVRRSMFNVQRSSLVGFIGRLCRQKGPDVLLAAVPEILRQAPEAMFLVVGGGPWERWIRRQVARRGWAERFRFETAGDEDEVAVQLRRMDVLVMPSRWEGLPYTLLEALAAGVPVVASDVGGVRDVVADAACAVLVPPAHPALLAAAVAGLLRDQAVRARLATAGRTRVAAFDLRAMIARTVAVYGPEADALTPPTPGRRAG